MSKNYEFLWRALSNVSFGSLTIEFDSSNSKKFTGNQAGPEAKIIIKNPALIDRVIVGGDVAFGESYIDGDWDSPDLISLLTFFTYNAYALENFFHAQKLRAIILFLSSFFTKNTKRGSKKNIKAHYDLGNDFYQLWLDETMTYSSALFNEYEISLANAQRQKYQNILEKLSGKSVLEIGCGWGGFAEIASKNNYQTTCLTISPKQKLFAEERMKKQQLENLVKIKLQDYRDEKNTYDNVVSIEMFEAVGKEYWDKYFDVVSSVLNKNGKAVLQIITIDEEVFKDYINRVDFIQKHIFPGGVLPSKTTVKDLANKHGLKVKSQKEFGLDYSKTLQIWLKNFDDKKSEIKNLGFSDEFIRKWRFYLAYCIAGFESKRTDVVQFELEKI